MHPPPQNPLLLSMALGREPFPSLQFFSMLPSLINIFVSPQGCGGSGRGNHVIDAAGLCRVLGVKGSGLTGSIEMGNTSQAKYSLSKGKH